MKKTLLLNSLVATGLMLSISGCSGVDLSNLQKYNPFKAPSPQEIIQSSEDPYLTKNFMEFFKQHKLSDTKVDYGKSYIKITEYISGQQGHVNDSASEAIREYENNYDNLDQIAKYYIELAKKRGSTVKMYKTFVSSKIASLLPIYGSDYRDNYSKFDLDNAFIEFDKNGMIKSILFRAHYFPRSIGTLHYRDTWIVFGKYAKMVQNSISNSFLQDGYITTFK